MNDNLITLIVMAAMLGTLITYCVLVCLIDAVRLTMEANRGYAAACTQMNWKPARGFARVKMVVGLFAFFFKVQLTGTQAASKTFAMNSPTIYQFQAILEEAEPAGFTATCVQLDVVSQGETRVQAMENLKEALALYIAHASEEEMAQRLTAFLEAREAGKFKNFNLIKFEVEMPDAEPEKPAGDDTVSVRLQQGDDEQKP